MREAEKLAYAAIDAWLATARVDGSLADVGSTSLGQLAREIAHRVEADLDAARGQAAALQQTMTEQKMALAHYGRHRPNCSAWIPLMSCTCGFGAALSGQPQDGEAGDA